MSLLKLINNGLLRLAGWGTIFFMAVIAVVIPYEVFGRYVIREMSTWSGEVSTFSLAWATMLGGAVGLRKGYQVGMTAVVDRASARVGRLLRTAGYLFMILFFGVMVYYGTLQTVVNLRQTSPAMGMVMAIPYASLPVGFFIMLTVTIEEFLLFLGPGEEQAPGAEVP